MAYLEPRSRRKAAAKAVFLLTGIAAEIGFILRFAPGRRSSCSFWGQFGSRLASWGRPGTLRDLLGRGQGRGVWADRQPEGGIEVELGSAGPCLLPRRPRIAVAATPLARFVEAGWSRQEMTRPP